MTITSDDDDYEEEKPAERGRFSAQEESDELDDYGSEEKPRFSATFL